MNGGPIHTPHLSRTMFLVGSALGAVAWIADAVVDGYLHHRHEALHAVFFPSIEEVLIRSCIILMVVGFSLYGGLVISRLRRSEIRLLESELRYRGLVDAGRDVILTISPDAVFTSLNPAFGTLTGWQPAAWIGKSFTSLIHPGDLLRAMTIFQQVMSGQAPDTFELRIRSQTGAVLTSEVTVMPQLRDGRVIGVLGIARDITRRKETERALQESEAKYRDLFENANDLIQSVGADGRLLYVNRAWRETLGYSEEELSGLTLLDIIHPDYRPHCMDLFRRVTSGEKLDNVEVVFVTKAGRSVVVEGNVNCTIIDGTPIATRGIFRDVTEHRHASDFIKNILESVDEGFIVINREYRIISANKAYADKLKLPVHDIIGQYCYEVSHRLTKPCYEAGEDCAVRRTFETGEPYTAIHVHYDHDGNPIYIETKAFPLRDSLGRIVSAIEIHNDITEKKRLEDQLRHAQKMEAVGTLAGGIAHDFNNILTAIIGYGTLLQMKMAPADPLKTHVDQIMTSTERAANLTQSLLAFSRKQVINLQAVDLSAIVRNVEKLVDRLIGEDIDITASLHSGPLTVRADAGQIEQVVVNLVTNARDAMKTGGTLVIATGTMEMDHEFIRAQGFGKVGRYAFLSVADSGIGMDERTRKRIFEPFYTTKEVGKGTGLGLAIVYGIVKQHGGYIIVDSEPGAGAMFRICLPLVTAVIATTRPVEDDLLTGGRATVLVAEDDTGVRNLTRAVLEGVGYTVITAIDGDDALAKFQEHRERIQLLLLDIIMPRKNGKMVYDEIQAMHPGIKALFTSGYTAEVIHGKGVLEDSLNFITKPVSPRDLLRKVKEVLDAGSDKAVQPMA